jgi:S-adenosylmethionine-diacylglycerol 3-amino-3-carboxypropyl transferase
MAGAKLAVVTTVDYAVKAFHAIDFSSSTTWIVIAGVALGALYHWHSQCFDMIEKICSRTYIYNICWEDPAVDRQILNISKDDVLFRICSAGDIVLDYAIEGPSKIVVCDLNPHQLYLFELKIRMLRDPNLTYEEWWSIWGSSDAAVAAKVWKRMRHTMSADARKWWDPRIVRTFAKGFATSGSCGFAAKWLIPSLMWLVGFDTKEWARNNWSHEYIAKHQYIVTKSARWFRWLFPTILAPFAGVPPNQIGPEFETTEFYEDMLRQIFLDPEFGKHNYFYRFYYEGGYKCQQCCPRTLQKEHFNALRSNAGCFEWHHASVQQTMERVKPHTFTKLVLLDHMDWMPNSMVHDEWVAIQRASVPGAQILWRSAFKTMDDKPFFNNLPITDLSPEWYSKDRVKTYPGTFVTYNPCDELPVVDTELSPCQVASQLRKYKTVAKMILHPLTAGKVNAHGDKMSAFYASQAKGYDAVRENMLVARPEMMSGFGTIKKGHTWLDVGGGTGRNLHYLRAQLDLFDTIVVLDICPELLKMGQKNAEASFTPAQCARINWVCLDINSPDVKKKLAYYMGGNVKRGFDNITFSYSLSMIPKWEEALASAKSLLSPNGRLLVADFDTYSEEGTTFKDYLIKTWYKQDGVRIEAKSRQIITNDLFPQDKKFHTVITRFQKPLLGVNIPHYVACCVNKEMPQSLEKDSSWEEKKYD